MPAKGTRRTRRGGSTHKGKKPIAKSTRKSKLVLKNTAAAQLKAYKQRKVSRKGFAPLF